MIELTLQNKNKIYINPDKIICFIGKRIDVTRRDMSAFAKEEFIERTEINLTDNILRCVEETPNQIRYIIKSFYERKGVTDTDDWDGI